MKILIDLTPLADNFSGIERYAACIAGELLSHRENTYCLLFKNGVHPLFRESVQQENVEYKVLKGRDKLFFNQLVLPAAIAGIKADYYLFLAFPVPVLLFKKNMVTTIHDICCWDCPETMTTHSKWYFRLSILAAVRKCRSVITISEFSKGRIMDRLGYPEEKIWLVGCGIEEKFCPTENKTVLRKYNLPDEYILSLSTIEPRKNIRLLIRAYRNAVVEEKKQLPPLVLAGRKGWNVDTLLDGIEQEVLDQILFTGFVNDEDLPAIYSGAKLFVFPSIYEGFGIPPLEAMACATPVLSSDASSLPEVLADAASYFESGNEEQLTEKLLKMAELSPEETAYLKRKCCMQAAKFTWKREAEKLLQYMK